jgi:DNA-binding CsgD family transcriptional regulator
VRQIPGLDPEVQARAGLTDRQAECLELSVRGASLRWIAAQLGVLNHQTIAQHLATAVAKVERVMGRQ